MSAGEVFAFEVSVKGNEWSQIVHATTRGQAKARYYRDVTDPYPDLPYTLIRARKVGRPRTSEEFIRVAVYRGLPKLRCGDRVVACGHAGVVVGHNDSANFDVLFDPGTPYGGQVGNVHPGDFEGAEKWQ